jgi:hypothetical protein
MAKTCFAPLLLPFAFCALPFDLLLEADHHATGKRRMVRRRSAGTRLGSER